MLSHDLYRENKTYKLTRSITKATFFDLAVYWTHVNNTKDVLGAYRENSGGITHYYHAHILECTHIHASVIPFQYTFLENYQWPCLVERPETPANHPNTNTYFIHSKTEQSSFLKYQRWKSCPHLQLPNNLCRGLPACDSSLLLLDVLSSKILR